jgi:hypothetical protein
MLQGDVKKQNERTKSHSKKKIFVTVFLFVKYHIQTLYSSLDRPINKAMKLRRVKWVGHVVRMGEMRTVHSVVRESERKRLLARHRHRWEDIKMYIFLPSFFRSNLYTLSILCWDLRHT